MDGEVHFLNRETFEIKKTLSLDTPINGCALDEGYLYVASRPSFKIELSTLSLTKLTNYNQIINHKGKIFGCSDEEGITCLSDGNTINVPC